VEKPFVVVSGLPASGKTTLARELASALSLRLIDKDDILDQLFDVRGIGDAAWRRTLSRESDELLRKEATASTGAVLSSFWHVSGMPPDSGTPIAWLAEVSDIVVLVQCVCPPELAAARFVRRRRHPGHLDTEAMYEQVLESLEALTSLGSLPIRPGITVDTSKELNAAVVVRDIRAAIAHCPRG
jgi:AAA domain